MAAKATIAYVHPNEVSASFHECLDSLRMYDLSTDGHLAHAAGQIKVRCGTDGLIAARNQIAQAFLDSDSEWLFVVDSDMGFAPNTLQALLAVADKRERPIVGALCFASREMGKDGMGGFRVVPWPTIYRFTETDDGKQFAAVSIFPVNELIRCDATGSACLVIHRSVLERIKAEFGSWYERIPMAGKLLGEDISFCVRAGALDIPVHVHTGIRTTHHKPWWVSEADFWQRYLPPPATELVDVLVPVLNRPQNAEPFMRSLRASTGLADAWAIVSPGDTESEKAWHAAGAEVLRANDDPFAVKINHGFTHTTNPWIFIVGDDVRFHPGWLDHAQHVANTSERAVVGTNDLANPRVVAGTHATHMLIRRDYVDSVGASWDGPGVVCHEGYRHQYVDDEIVTAAKQRNQFAMALGSVVEHLHPIVGKAEVDEVYELGEASAKLDRAVFRKRVKHYGGH